MKSEAYWLTLARSAVRLIGSAPTGARFSTGAVVGVFRVPLVLNSMATGVPVWVPLKA
ncbi:hypothetical protein D3C79_1050900 [compost metagenome]